MNSAMHYTAEIVMSYCREDRPARIYDSEACCSYSRWAAKELYFRLCRSDEPPLMVLEQFRDTMAVYARRYPRAEQIFATAVQTAEHFIKILS